MTKLVETYGDAVLPIQLDITDRGADFDAVKRAADHFGKLDVVINNAGYGHFGMIEELTEDPDGHTQRDPQSGRRRQAAAAHLLRQSAARGCDPGLRVTHGDVERNEWQPVSVEAHGA